MRDAIPPAAPTFCGLSLARKVPGLSLALFFIFLEAGFPPRVISAADEPTKTGEQIYHSRCAACHGAHGEGTTEHYPQPLAGERSAGQLAEFVSQSMPPETDQKCTGVDAENVAAYIFEAFYSPAARANQPGPRFQWNRLTARQYRHAIADLMTSFRGGTWPRDERQGLLGSYNTIDPKGEGLHVMERIDPEIRFDYGKSSPDPERIHPLDFSILWRGSIYAPLTGEYTFVLRSEHAVKLLVDNRVEPLIDQWIKSGNETEFRGVVHLLGGRFYPLELFFSKAVQGVRMPPELKAKAEIAPASIRLSWIPPGRNEQIVPKEYLSPLHAAESYFVTTPFPPDDRSTGFERGNSISKEWDQATTSAALEVADYVLLRLRDLTGSAEPGPEYESRLRTFCGQWAERAFRRPLTGEQRQLYLDRQFAAAPDLETAVQRVVMLTLKSPRFLHHDVADAPHDGYEAASRLSFALWDAPPDAPLLAAAVAGKLADREELARQAERMSRDPRCAFKLREFLLQWTKLDQVRELSKSAEQFPGFDERAVRDLRTSLELFLEELTASADCDFRQLMLSEALYLNGSLSMIYGGNLPPDAPFQKVTVEAGQRAGVISHPYVMAVFADATDTSPIRRGVFLARGVLGRALLPPKDAVTPLPPSLHPELTTRERVMLQTKSEACQTCHALINPLGFPLEHFDAIGRYRSEEKSRPIDAVGEYLSRGGESKKFQGARELAEYLAQSEEAHTAFAEKLFQFAVQQSPRTFGPETVAKLQAAFVAGRFNMRHLLAEIAVVAAAGPLLTEAKVSQK